MRLVLDVADADVEVLEQALRGAIATERYEAARANRLVVTGYGDRAGGTLDSEADRALRRVEVLSQLVETLILTKGKSKSSEVAAKNT